VHFGEGFTGTTWHWYDVRESWTYSEEYVGKDIKAEVYTDADAIDWYVNGIYAGRSVTKEAISSINTKYEPGNIRAVAIKDGKEVSEYTLKTAHGCEQIVLTPEACSFKADGRDLCYVRVSLTDKEGVPYVTDERHLKCEVSGGKLLAFFSGDPMTEVPAGIPECDTHHGKALAIISSKAPGDIKIIVSGEELASCTVTVKAI
jgi:beta-galactosidase